MVIMNSTGLDISLGQTGTGIRYANAPAPGSRLAKWRAKTKSGAEAAAAIIAATTPEQQAAMRAKLVTRADARAQPDRRVIAAQAAAAEHDRRMVEIRKVMARQAAIDVQTAKQRATEALWGNAIAANNPTPAAPPLAGMNRIVANLRARNSSTSNTRFRS